jgi:hypothetical protein
MSWQLTGTGGIAESNRDSLVVRVLVLYYRFPWEDCPFKCVAVRGSWQNWQSWQGGQTGAVMCWRDLADRENRRLRSPWRVMLPRLVFGRGGSPSRMLAR